MKFTVEHEISTQRICDLMTSAILRNLIGSAWCSSVDAAPRPDGHLIAVGDAHWYEVPYNWEGEFRIAVTECDNVTRKTLATHIVGPTQLSKAFAAMATHHSVEFSDILTGNEDDATADMLLQLAALGEVRYG